MRKEKSDEGEDHEMMGKRREEKKGETMVVGSWWCARRATCLM